MTVIAEVSITPIGKGESLGPWVARAVGVIARSGLKYQVGPMGTTLEGDWDAVARVLGDALRAVAEDCNRVTMSVKVDYRKGMQSMEEKVQSVARSLGRPVPTTLIVS